MICVDEFGPLNLQPRAGKVWRPAAKAHRLRATFNRNDGVRHMLCELAFYHCWTPQPVPLTVLITVAGRRWSIEEGFQAAKTQVGLDHYQCRGWTTWHRFVLLAMLALAVLVTAASDQQPDRVSPRHDELVPVSVGELRRLILAAQLRDEDMSESTGTPPRSTP